MCSTTALAISESFCGVLKTQAFFASMGVMIATLAAIPLLIVFSRPSHGGSRGTHMAVE